MSTAAERLKILYDITSAAVKRNWPEKSKTWLAQRYAMMCASGLFKSDKKEHHELALKLIDECGEMPDCSFCPMLSMKVIRCYEHLLTDSVKNKLLTYLKESAFEKMLLPDFDYVGVNDNFPSMASYVALVGGEYFNDKRAFEIGMDRLKEFSGMLTRRDMASEFSSPCYLPFSIIAMSAIVNDVKDDNARAMALKCEKQLWLDIVNHYYPEFNLTAGPYSRAYAAETLAQPSSATSIMYLVFGVGDSKNLVSEEICDDNELDARSLWIASSADYHCPDEYIDIAINKKYPFEVSMTAEIAPCRYQDSDDIKSLFWNDYKETALKKDRLDEYPGGVTTTTTYIEKAFAMGTSLRSFHSGIQTDSLHIIYNKDNNANTIFTKYSVNDKIIGQENYNEWLECKAMPCLDDEGRKFGIQTGSTSLMVYKPTYFCHDRLREARLQIIFSTLGKKLEKVYFDNKYIDGEATSKSISPFYVSDGSIYAAFIPLEVTDLGRDIGMKFSYINDFAVFALYNYKGSESFFRKNQMLLSSNGFVVIVKSKDNFDSFEHFIETYSKYTLKDEMIANGHTRGSHERKIYFKNKETEFDFAYSPMTEGIRYAVANGKTIV